MIAHHPLPTAGAATPPTAGPTEECLAFWVQVMDALPFYAMLIDADHRIVAHNRAVCDHRGDCEILGQYCPRVIHGTDHPYPGCPLEDAVARGTAVEREFHDAPTDRWSYSAVFPTRVTDAQGRALFFHVARDITDDVRARAQLSQSLEHHKALEDLLRHLQDAKSPEAAIETLVDLTLGLSWMNVTCGAAAFLREDDALRLVGTRGLDETVWQRCAHVPLGHCHCGEAAAAMLPIFRDCEQKPDSQTQSLDDGHAQRGPHAHATFPLVADGRAVGVVSFYVAPEGRLGPHQRAFLEAAVKVAAAAVAQRQAQADAEAARARATALERALLERVMASQEEERRRVARELHDDLGQGLSALLLDVRGAARSGAPVDEFAARLETSIRGVIDRLYHLAWDLRPQVLDDFGLDTALRRYISHVTERSGLTIDCDFVHEPGVPERVDPKVEVAVYRLAQEALTNVVRHAKASRASVLVYRRRGSLTLLVEDDGVGMSGPASEPPTDSHGFGLTGMRERAALLRGQFVIESTPGEGTSVRVQLPVDDAEPGRSPEPSAAPLR